jgi:glycosyltransferase involved in cell wall biosynthesis
LLSELAALSEHAEVIVIETPCKIQKGDLSSKIKWIDRREVKRCRDIDDAVGGALPDVYICGGWFDPLFLRYARHLHKLGKTTVLAIDTPWKGTIRQKIHRIISQFTLVPIFDYAWGAGDPQRQHFIKLGFSASCIRNGYYCADTNKFAPIGEDRIKESRGLHSWPHKMLYIGRYVAVKNMRMMERAFIAASEGTDWKLICVGSGELWEERIIHPRIEHLGYKQPNEIQNFIKSAGCFVLPSLYEPWGVVVHEAALMGLPLLCSNQIQSASKFLNDGVNGFKFNPCDESSVMNAMRRMMNLNDSDLREMGYRSFALGKSYCISDWVKQVMEFSV